MARIVACSSRIAVPLSEGWECAITEPGAAASPGELGDLDWIPASVPGTAAFALRAAGRWDGEPPLELDDRDVWYRMQFVGQGEEVLRFGGLATIADVWLNGRHMFRSENMFLAREVAAHCGASNQLHICFRSLSGWLVGKRGHARWRTRLALPSTLRFARTTLLGRMPGWCPNVPPAGPWRPVERLRRTEPFDVRSVDLRAGVRGSDGTVSVTVGLDGAVPVDVFASIEIGDSTAELQRSGAVLTGSITIPRVARW